MKNILCYIVIFIILVCISLPLVSAEEPIVGPEAKTWLKSNKNEAAFAVNRFQTTKGAQTFVKRLYDLGAEKIVISPSAIDDEGEDGGPYADTLIVTLPKNPAKRKLLFQEHEKENEDGKVSDSGQIELVFWWD